MQTVPTCSLRGLGAHSTSTPTTADKPTAEQGRGASSEDGSAADASARRWRRCAFVWEILVLGGAVG